MKYIIILVMLLCGISATSQYVVTTSLGKVGDWNGKDWDWHSKDIEYDATFEVYGSYIWMYFPDSKGKIHDLQQTGDGTSDTGAKYVNYTGRWGSTPVEVVLFSNQIGMYYVNDEGKSVGMWYYN